MSGNALRRLTLYMAVSRHPGIEQEELFDAGLNLIGSGDNRIGEVSGFASPGGIHASKNRERETLLTGRHVERDGHSHRPTTEWTH